MQSHVGAMEIEDLPVNMAVTPQNGSVSLLSLNAGNSSEVLEEHVAHEFEGNLSALRTSQKSVVGVFWDGDHMSGIGRYDLGRVCNVIRTQVNKFGTIVERLYYFDRRRPCSAAHAKQLDLAGFKLIHCPRQLKQTAVIDKKLIVDLILFAWKHQQLGARCTIFLLSNDEDYAYALNRLRDEGVQVIVAASADCPAPLAGAADVKLDFKTDILDLVAQEEAPFQERIPAETIQEAVSVSPGELKEAILARYKRPKTSGSS